MAGCLLSVVVIFALLNNNLRNEIESVKMGNVYAESITHDKLADDVFTTVEYTLSDGSTAQARVLKGSTKEGQPIGKFYIELENGEILEAEIKDPDAFDINNYAGDIKNIVASLISIELNKLNLSGDTINNITNETYETTEVTQVITIDLSADSVNSTHIINNSILNEDISASAAIAWSKVSKAGSSLADLDTRNASDLNNDIGFLTSFTETDPIFTASDAFGIGAVDISNWDTAYGWGNHSLAGYVTGGVADSTYLKLDASNGPITGDLSINGSLTTNAALRVIGNSAAFDSAFIYSGSVYTDITAEVAESQGTARTIINTTAYKVFLGKNSTFSNIYFDMGNVPVNLTLQVDYSQGGGSWGTLTVSDGTLGLTQDGTMSFTPPVDWATDTVNGVSAYWVRLGSSTSSSPDATTYLIIPDVTNTSDVVNFAPNPGDTSIFNIDGNGYIRMGNVSTGAITASGAIAMNGALSGATTGTFSSAVTVSRSGIAFVSTDGLVSRNTTASTAAVPIQNSPRLRLSGTVWDATLGASQTVNWKNEVIPISGTTGTSKLVWGYGYNTVTDTGFQQMMALNSEGTLDVMGNTFGSETLTNGDLTGGTSWSATPGFTLSTDRANYAHSAGPGTGILTQSSGSFATPAAANRMYRFTYTTSSVVAGCSAYIGTEFADKTIYLPGISATAGTYDVVFKSNAAPGDFVIYASSTAGSFRIDTFSLVESQSGDIIANGQLTGGGADGIKIQANGNVGIGTTNPGAKLEVEIGSTDAVTGLLIDQQDLDQIGLQIVQAANATANALDISSLQVSGNVLDINWSAPEVQEAAIKGISLDFDNLTDDNTSDLFGIYVNDFSSGGAGGTQYGIYIAGTNWDYGLNVEDASYFGSSITQAGNSTIYKADPSIVFDSLTATDTDFWLGVQEDAGGDDDDVFQIGDGANPGTNPFLSILTSGYVGIGTVDPQSTLDVNGEIKASKINKVIVVDGIRYAQTCAGINDAIDDLGSTGGEIYLPEGTYTCTETITIDYNNTTIRGAGKTATVIDASAGQTFGYIIQLNGKDYLTITDLKILGQADGGNSSNTLIYGSAVINSAFQNLTLQDSDTQGINLVSSSYNTIENIDAINNDSVGIMLDGSTYNNRVINNYAYDTTRCFQGQGYNNVFSGNTTLECGIAFDLSLTTYSTISGNTIRTPGGTGFSISGDYNTINGNTIQDDGTANTGISLGSTADYNIVNNNIITGFTGGGDTGISITAGATDNSLIGNLLYNNTNNITNSGTNTQITSPVNGILSIGDYTGITSLDGTGDIYIADDLEIDGGAIFLAGAATDIDLINSTVNALSFETNLISLDTLNTRVGIGTIAPTELLDINSDSIRIRTGKTPASASDTCDQGEISWDDNFIYVCTATDTWKRSGIATW
ncbi:hypothetical protein JW978_01825 [Candidatus Dojkabacteria bacterium]|nr:hypothetical protein [Candidatus Dojkabacteria bacterium]